MAANRHKTKEIITTAKNTEFSLSKAIEKERYNFNGASLFSIFDDLLTYMIHGFTINEPPLPSWKHSQEENAIFWELSLNIMAEYVKARHEKKPIDLFGTAYEELAAIGDKKHFGQFFTPLHICELMAQICGNVEKKGDTVYDPTCGSGRMFLTKFKYDPNAICVGGDIDFTCVKMTALNLLLNGIEGCVYHMDSLKQTYLSDFCYVVNPMRATRGEDEIFCVRKEIKNEASA